MTSNVLEYIRQKIKEIVFCSTGSVYGEVKTIPTPENDKISNTNINVWCIEISM